jgi:GTP cyclohydrolase I
MFSPEDCKYRKDLLPILKLYTKHTKSVGVMVVIEAQHLCMQMRGVEKQNSVTTTSDFTGVFQQAKTREEFVNLIRR